jgi:hypothetical protein
MNGRVYDYRLGRFLSPDPFVVEPLNIQSHNPYSYVLNNPYSGTDPTGYQAAEAEGCQRPDRPECQTGSGTAGVEKESSGAASIGPARKNSSLGPRSRKTPAGDAGVDGYGVPNSESSSSGSPDGGIDASDSANRSDRPKPPEDRGEGEAHGPPCTGGCRYRASKDYQDGQAMTAEARRIRERTSHVNFVGREGYFFEGEVVEVRKADLDPELLFEAFIAESAAHDATKARLEAAEDFGQNMMEQASALRQVSSRLTQGFSGGYLVEASLLDGAFEITADRNVVKRTDAIDLKLRMPGIKTPVGDIVVGPYVNYALELRYK